VNTTTHAGTRLDGKLFTLLIVLGIVCAAMGGGVMWLDHSTSRADGERNAWVSGEAQLYEAGIRWTQGKTGDNYELTARYELKIGEQTYPGSGIAAGHSSKSPPEVKALLVPFAPEAADFSLQDLGPLNPERSWSVAYVPVPVRYDPRDPARSELVLTRPIATATLGRRVVRGIEWTLVLAGIGLCAFAWPAARVAIGPVPQQSIAGPAWAEYPEADRRRFAELIDRVLAEIARLSVDGTTVEMRYYGVRIAQMATEARNGSLVPSHYAQLQLGRGADEIFGDGRLCAAAAELQTCIDRLASGPGSAHVAQ